MGIEFHILAEFGSEVETGPHQTVGIQSHIQNYGRPFFRIDTESESDTVGRGSLTIEHQFVRLFFSEKRVGDGCETVGGLQTAHHFIHRCPAHGVSRLKIQHS